VILVYDHSYWAYIPVVGKKKKQKTKLTARFTKFLVQAHLAGESSKASIETWRSVGSDLSCPAPNLSFSSLDHLF
jgi:hypothetical protein